MTHDRRTGLKFPKESVFVITVSLTVVRLDMLGF